MNPFDLIIYPALFLFIFVSSLFWHELCHIIGTGRLWGTIDVTGFSMQASPANLWVGGLGAGLVFSIAGGLIWAIGTHALGYLFIICGAVNLCYFPFEALFLPQWGNNWEYKLGRYTIYVGVTCTMVLLWVAFLQ